MKVIYLKFQVLFLVSCLLALGAGAQNSRFIYIQTENKEPFYVKIDKRSLNSSATGYLIIDKLTENNYQLTIGFPDNELPVLNVTVGVKDANTGFLLKRSGGKDWAMVNLLTMKPIPVEIQSTPPAKEVETVSSTDEFARILAEVVNDPSIAQVIVEKKAVEPPVKIDDDKTVKVPVVQEKAKEVPAGLKTNDVLINRSEIKKLSKDSTSEGLLMAYRDNANADTVKIFMPVNKRETVSEKATQTVFKDTVAKKADVVNTDARFINMELQNPNLKTDSGSIKKDDLVITKKKNAAENSNGKLAGSGSNSGKGMLNPACKRSATENDFLKLRKAMAAADSEKNMTRTAIKQFITTCYTAEQVKILGALFITQEEKYKFFVAAFPHVWDTGNFRAMADQLSDEYYKTRFKAMFNH